MRPTLPLQVKFRKLRTTTKDVGRGFYKGNRTGSMGEHTKYGGYRIDWAKVRTYVVPPNLSQFPLTPFVSRTVLPTNGQYPGNPLGPRSPAAYLALWKRENGLD